jgi:dinuclear metal center YbgI/SA1388 family protein
VKIQDVVVALERFAPLPLQEGFDNAGLQVGLTETDVSGALLCLDVTEAVIDEAISLGCNLIVSHHPLLFHPLKQISDKNDVQRMVRKAIRNDITILSMHTNIDNAVGGVNYKIAEKLGLEECQLFCEKQVGDIQGGSGVVGVFTEPMGAKAFIRRMKAVFGVMCVMGNELLQRPIRKVAICGGAGSFLLPEAIAMGADAFITGEMHYHEYFAHEQEIQIAVIGHYQSEQYTAELFAEILHASCPELKTYITSINTNPIHYF